MTFAQVRKLARQGNVIPLFERVASDLETPVSAFLKIAKGKKNAFLLESIEGGEQLARYSFIGFDPFLMLEADSDGLKVRQGKKARRFDCPPPDFLKELFGSYAPVRLEGLPRFTGGGVGYFGYDTIRWFEKIPDSNPDPLELPEMMLGMYATVVAFDHLKQEIVIIANILHEGAVRELKVRYEEAVTRIEEIKKRLERPLANQAKEPAGAARVKSLCSQAEFEKMVKVARKHIKEGDIFQAVLSQRWEVSTGSTPLDIYRRLRRINPSPYMFLLQFENISIIGASPEMMVRVEDDLVETRPIAGTRPRGRTAAEDDRLAASLLADKKELAEHTMLLDLGRNDIGRVAKAGSVEVKTNMAIERYSHVMHIVSSVGGRLAKGKSALDALFACAPAGTVSGAPKVRAMEIIDQLELIRRGVYAGTVAYLDFWGNLDSCIAIRTVVGRGNKYMVQAGAGIVADSKPAREYQETVNKAKALLAAVTGKNQK